MTDEAGSANVVDTASAQSRTARFRALRLRAGDAKKQNRSALYQEHARMKSDPQAARAMDNKKSVAAQKLAKMDAHEAGEDFERKRAWDWTIAESRAWDAKKEAGRERRDEDGFADYAQEAAKQYARNTRRLLPDLDAYAREKAANASADHGGDDDNDGATGSVAGQATLPSVAFIHQKPERGSIDRLITDLSKTDAARLKAKAKRGRGVTDEGDYISDRNKVFNQKVARFYDKYTQEMKDSFERGTAN